MRAYKIEFHGYKRLWDTKCNVDGRMIAFLGPNEAGKSSILQALSWASTGDPLDPKLSTRGREAEPGVAIVRVHYRLEESDYIHLQDIAMEGKINTFVVEKHSQGDIRVGAYPSPQRESTAFNEAIRALENLINHYPGEFESENSDLSEEEIRNLLKFGVKVLQNRNSWSEEWDEEYNQLLDWLNEGIIASGNEQATPRARDVASKLEQARGLLQSPHPRVTVRQALYEQVPEFALFSDAERNLASAYELSDENIRNEIPAALANILWLAELDISELWSTIQNGDIARTRTLERNANKALAKRLGSRWRQERIDMELNVNGTVLEVLIAEHHKDGSITPLDERSDGLRVFVALVAFLARHSFDLPPILLVDEIETHLHIDAQADLVEVLSKDVQAKQVFYTTHSPGALPRDLGTGLRLVTPEKSDRSVSQIRNNFWAGGPGFTPLLFAMGAGAAAFSALRKALFCEGASDMILLPTLFRIAIDQDDIGFQVAPGISSYNGHAGELEESAIKVAYLLDGDQGGKANVKRLLSKGIDESRIVQLDNGMAIEDYIDKTRYIEVVQTLINTKMRIDIDELSTDITIGRAIEDWCLVNCVKTPSKTAIASALVQEPELIHLDPEATEKLVSIYQRITKILN